MSFFRSLRSSLLRPVAPLLLLLAVACTSTAPLAKVPAEPVHVVILHTNDLHGATRSVPGTWISKENPPQAGGFAALAAKVKAIEEAETKAGATVLLVDCGDFFQGTPEGDMTEGKIVVDSMNAMGVDVLQVGNHDFDQGPAVTEALSKRAKFPFLGANVRKAGTQERPAWLRETVDYPELGIQFAGLLTSMMPSVSTPKARVGLEFDDEFEALARVRWTDGRVRVLLTHVGIEIERKLAATGTIHALLGGHSHSRVTEMVGNVPVLQSGDKGTNLGRMDLWVDRATGTLVRSETKLLPVLAAEGEDPAVAAVVAGYTPEIDAKMGVVVGVIPEELSRRSDGTSTPLGNLLTDLMREATSADIAIHNRTSIRDGLAKGPVTERDIYEVSPFRNTLITMTLTGAQVRRLLEDDLAVGRLRTEASGLTATYDLEAKSIGEVTVGGAPLDPERRYKVVTNSHLARGGSGYKTFTEGTDVVDTGLDLLDLHREQVKTNPNRPVDRTLRVRPVEAAGK